MLLHNKPFIDEMYLNTAKGKNGCYGQVNTKVRVVNDSHHPVMIVEREDEFRFSCKVDELGYAPVIIEVHEENKIKKQRESKKPLTQAEKIQLEYLNSLK